MKVAILGGSGLLGRHIAAGLVDRGAEVVVLTRDPAAVESRIPSGPRLLAWSSADPEALASAVRGTDAVINLAGVSVGPRPWTAARRRAILASRLAATRAIVAAIAALDSDVRPRVLVSASGTDVYTGQDGVATTEASAPSEGFLARVCLAWEAEAERARAAGVRVVILRIGFVLAPDAPSLRLYALPFRFHLGGPIGSGRQWMSWIHIRDLVRLVFLALDDPRVDGIVNAVAPALARQADVAESIAAALGRRSWLRVPAWAVRLAMQAQSILPLGSRRIAPARAIELGFRFEWVDLRGAMVDVLAGSSRSRRPR
jgi:uncharacterized protein (TIGR01777 family)